MRKKICISWKLIERIIISRNIYHSAILTRYLNCAMDASLLDRTRSSENRECAYFEAGLHLVMEKRRLHKFPAKQAWYLR